MPRASSPTPPPAPLAPMLASVADGVPSGTDWVHEVKWDGMRVLVDVREGHVRLWSRSGRDVTASFPELEALGATFPDLLLDGEVVALEDGLPSFGALADRMHVGDRRRAERLAATRPVTFMAFDLLRLFGQDLTGLPWDQRRTLLDRLDLRGTHWQVPTVHDDGRALLAATAEQGLEGIVSKRRSAPYTPGRRSVDWRKSAHRATLSVVVGGWRPELLGHATARATSAAAASARGRLGAVLVGLPDGAGGWSYAGRVGSGLAGGAGVALLRRLSTRTRATSPFSDEVPRMDADGTTWVEPTIVVEVRALGRSSGGRLRQPAYLGVRSDLTPSDLSEAGDG